MGTPKDIGRERGNEEREKQGKGEWDTKPQLMGTLR